jgi:hypothetical protein
MDAFHITLRPRNALRHLDQAGVDAILQYSSHGAPASCCLAIGSPGYHWRRERALGALYGVKVLLYSSIPILAWYILKPYLLRLQEGLNIKREYQNTLIKVCNPYCGACLRSHKKIETLLERNQNIKVKMLFRTSDNRSDPSISVVRHFLAIAQGNDRTRLKEALDNWYLSDIQDYRRFSEAFSMNGELENQYHRVDHMNLWCKSTGITFTPTYFINGNQLPDVYNIEDLEYFLLE